MFKQTLRGIHQFGKDNSSILSAGIAIGGIGGIMVNRYRPDDVRDKNPFYNITHGEQLAGIMGGAAALLFRNPYAAAAAAGIAATFGGLAGDLTHTKLEPSEIAASNAISGAAAAVLAGAHVKLVPMGNKALSTWLTERQSHQGQVWANNIFSTAKNLRASHPIFRSIFSERGIAGLLTLAAIPLAHKMIRRIVAEKSMETHMALEEGMLGQFLHPEDESPPLVGQKFIPTSTPPAGNLNFVVKTSEHHDEDVILNELNRV